MPREKISATPASPVLTGRPGDAHFHRQSCVQSGTLDHDTQHPRPCGGACVQVKAVGVQAGVAAGGLGFPPSSGLFVSLLWISDVLC